MFAANVVLMVAGLLTPFANHFLLFSAMRFIGGMAYDSSLQIFYLLGEFDKP